MENTDYFEKAINVWGTESQLNMVIEECAELIQAVNKFRRNPDGCNTINLAEECADVEIMCQQVRCIVGSMKVENIKHEKMKRLINMLENY